MEPKRVVFIYTTVIVLSALAVACNQAPNTAATISPQQTAALSQPPLSPSPTCAAIDYQSPIPLFGLSIDGYPYQMASADFNGDGLMDIFLAMNTWPSADVEKIEILLNDGNGSLVKATNDIFVGTVPSTQHPRHTILADFNGDGITDIFIADHGQDVAPWPGYHNILVLSAPDGKLVDYSANIPQQPDYSHSAAYADIDDDGDFDLYIGNTGGEAGIPPEVWLNDGSGNFIVAEGRLPPEQIDLGLNVYTASAFADVNNDNTPDLILGGIETTLDSVVLLNDGAGYFSLYKDALPAKPISPESIAAFIKPADIDGDPFIDLIISYALGWGTATTWQGRYLQILINNGDGTFRDETETRLPQTENNNTWVQEIALYDIDHDGDLDITTKHVENFGVLQPYYLNTGGGIFCEPNTLHRFMHKHTHLYNFIDLDGDGGLDSVSIMRDGRVYISRDLGCRVEISQSDECLP
ncbi:MAG: VCBS repeat-containing protein [Anaerolineales bacterium]|jgi:hypothetical protein